MRGVGKPCYESVRYSDHWVTSRADVSVNVDPVQSLLILGGFGAACVLVCWVELIY